MANLSVPGRRRRIRIANFTVHFLAGAFGQVYHCRDLQTGGDVAVKTILRGEQMLIKYICFEVQNHIILRHPNVVDFKVQAPCSLRA